MLFFRTSWAAEWGCAVSLQTIASLVLSSTTASSTTLRMTRESGWLERTFWWDP